MSYFIVTLSERIYLMKETQQLIYLHMHLNNVGMTIRWHYSWLRTLVITENSSNNTIISFYCGSECGEVGASWRYMWRAPHPVTAADWMWMSTLLEVVIVSIQCMSECGDVGCVVTFRVCRLTSINECVTRIMWPLSLSMHCYLERDVLLMAC